MGRDMRVAELFTLVKASARDIALVVTMVKNFDIERLY